MNEIESDDYGTPPAPPPFFWKCSREEAIALLEMNGLEPTPEDKGEVAPIWDNEIPY